MSDAELVDLEDEVEDGLESDPYPPASRLDNDEELLWLEDAELSGREEDDDEDEEERILEIVEEVVLVNELELLLVELEVEVELDVELEELFCEEVLLRL